MATLSQDEPVLPGDQQIVDVMECSLGGSPEGWTWSVYRWGADESRIAEIDLASDTAGYSWMQSDLPWGLAICTQAERLAIAVKSDDDAFIEEESAILSDLLAMLDSQQEEEEPS